MIALPSPSVLNQLDIPRSQRVNGIGTGHRLSRRTGPGTEILSARPYVYGDDSRQVDWNASARTGELHVKQRINDTSVPVRVILDASSSMRFGTAQRKWDIAASAALLMAAIAVRGQEPVSVTLAGTAPRHVALRGGRNFLPSLERMLIEPPEWDEQGSLKDALVNLALPHVPPSAIVVVSDAYASRDDQTALAQASIRHSVAYLEVTDPAEIELPNIGRVRLQDPETRRVYTVNTGRDRVRDTYRERMAQQRATLAEALTRQGIPVLALTTSQPAFPQLIGRLPRRRP